MKMASLNRRSWKFQDFVAHEANVNCVSLGHKSGRVLVTGGDDKKVNLWAVGKSSCFMSLTGHLTPIECVQFNHPEEQVCAGSRAGTLKVWDLEAAKLLRTMNGHKYAIKTIDFHPYGNYLASGSADSSIKMWDSRKKGFIFSYEEHKSTVNSLKFSPDGNWIASGGDDATIKIWDLRVGKILKEFIDHVAPVTSVQFHPHEFLLASGSKDRSVNIFDLENFNLVSNEMDIGSVRCLWFHHEEDCLFAGIRDYLKVLTWEPNKIQDTLFVNWGRISDLSSTHNHLIGASFNLTNVQVYMADLTKVKPFLKTSDGIGNPFTPTTSSRRSFSKAERPVTLKPKALSKTIEESTSGTDPEEDTSANITNITDYNEIFRGRSLNRTPPPETSSPIFQEPEHDYSDPTQPQKLVMMDSFEALSLDNSINNYRNNVHHHTPQRYSRSKSNLDQIFDNSRTTIKPQVDVETENNFLPNINKNNKLSPKQKVGLQRQTSTQDDRYEPKNNFNIRQSLSDANLSKNNNAPAPKNVSRRGSFSRQVRSGAKMPNINGGGGGGCVGGSVVRNNASNEIKSSNLISSTPDIYVSVKLSPDELMEEDDIVPGPLDRPVGLEFDDFLPKSHQILGFQQQLPEMSEAEVLGVILRGHEPMMSVINTRQRSLDLVSAKFRSKDIKAAVEMAIAMDDLSILVDILGVFNEKYSIWNLDLCVAVLPKVQDLLQSKFETYILTGCNTLKLVLRHFGPVIKNNIQSSSSGSFGVDIPREERYRKSMKCNEILLSLRPYVVKKQSTSGNIGAAFKEVNLLMETLFD